MKYFAMVVAVALIAVAIYSLVMGGFSYTSQQELLNVGPIQATVNDTQRLLIPQPVSIALLAGGVIVLLVTSIRALSHR